LHTGIAKVEWFLDGAYIGNGTSRVYNFDQHLGVHTLKVVATDRVGLTAEYERDVYAVPGAIGGLQNLGLLPSDPIETPTPEPDPSPSQDPSPSPSPSQSPDGTLPIEIPVP
jgi:hypothetical protein